MLFIQYRGKVSESYEKSLKKISAPCKVIFIIQKLKTVLPSLKSEIPKVLKSGVAYNISCSRCKSCYVGQTARHLQTRIKEHSRQSSLLGNHFKQCNNVLTMDDVSILATAKSIHHLLSFSSYPIRFNSAPDRGVYMQNRQSRLFRNVVFILKRHR